MKTCDHCGRLITRRISPDKKRWHFCNRGCLTAARKRGGVIALSRQSDVITCTCALPECGKTFTLRNKRKQYCDRKCAGVARRAGGVIAQKVEATMLAHHGVKRFFCDGEKTRSAMRARLGVDNVSNVPGLRKESWKKAHETKKRNGTYKASKIELAVCQALRDEGCEVLTQHVVLGRPIDVVIVGVESLYVQVNGRYWHGLDRSIEAIKASSKPRDLSIVERWSSDRAQDEQFEENGLRLVRVTDSEAKEWLKQRRKLLPLMVERANSTKSMSLPVN